MDQFFNQASSVDRLPVEFAPEKACFTELNTGFFNSAVTDVLFSWKKQIS
jgi:hypothetical protein